VRRIEAPRDGVSANVRSGLNFRAKLCEQQAGRCCSRRIPTAQSASARQSAAHAAA